MYVIMYTMKKAYSATEARKQFFKILEAVGKSGTNIKITFEGRPSLVLITEDEYESLIETIEVLSDPELMEAIDEGMKEMKAGKKGVTLEELKKEFRL